MPKDRAYVNNIVLDQIHRMLLRKTPRTQPEKFRETLWYAYIRFYDRPLRHQIEKMMGGFNLAPQHKSKVLTAAVAVLTSPEIPKGSLKLIVRKFINNPEDHDNLVALAIAAQRVEVEIPRTAYEKAVAKYGYLAQYLLTGEARIREDYIRDHPEVWIVVRTPKVKIVEPKIQKKTRRRRRKAKAETQKPSTQTV